MPQSWEVVVDDNAREWSAKHPQTGVCLRGLGVAVLTAESTIPMKAAVTSSKTPCFRTVNLTKGDSWKVALGDQTAPSLEAVFTFRTCGDDGEGFEVCATLKNVSEDIFRVKKVLLASHDYNKASLAPDQGPLLLPGSPAQWWVYRHAWSSISLSHAVNAASGTEADFFSPVVRPTLLPTFARHQLYDTEDDVRQPDGEFRSEGFVVLGKEEGKGRGDGGGGSSGGGDAGGISVAIGASNPRSFNLFARLSLRRPLLEVGVHLDGIPLDPGETVSLGGVLVFASGAGSQGAMLRLFDAWSALARPVPDYERGDAGFVLPEGAKPYARVAAALAGVAAASTNRKLWMWNSWSTGKHTLISEAWVLDNLSRAAACGLPFDVFQVDDGYQKAQGDWLETNAKFPSGLASLLRSIQQAGFRPGLWTAPLVVESTSKLYAEHPDWLLQDERGTPLRTGLRFGYHLPYFTYGLDPTHPGVLGWLTDTFKQLRQWGVSLFKVDFLCAHAIPARYHDAKCTRAAAYEKVSTAIRAGIGRDAQVMAAISPLLGGLGWTDFHRTSTDCMFGSASWNTWMSRILVDRTSPSIENCMRGAVGRTPMHHKLWANDNDAVLTMGVPGHLVRLQLSVHYLTSAVVQVSHDFTLIAQLDTSPFAALARYRVDECWNAELMASEWPSLFLARATLFPPPPKLGETEASAPATTPTQGQPVLLAAVCNFSDKLPQARTVDLPALARSQGWGPLAFDKCRDLWTDVEYDARQPISLTIPRLDCCLLVCSA